MGEHIPQIQSVNTLYKNKITDYAKIKNVGYGRSDASLTVESAMVLPLVIFLIMTFLLWIQFFQVQEDSMRTLNEQLRQISGAAAVAQEAVRGSAELLPEEIILEDTQTLHFLAGFTPGEQQFRRWAKLRLFTGRRYAGEEGEGEEEEEKEMVWLTETGSVYHVREDCTHLKLSVSRTVYEALNGLRNQNGAIYHACEVCVGKNAAGKGTLVYITREGNRYHLDISCRGLLRRIRCVTKKEALEQGRRPCSRCGGKEEGS